MILKPYKTLVNGTDYPVGENFDYNLSVMKKMATIINKNTTAETNERLNFLCTGSSGAIIAGVVSSKLDMLGYNCKGYRWRYYF